MEALLEIKAQVSLEASDVSRIVVRAPGRQFSNLPFRNARTALEAKFSMEFVLATILLRGDLGLGDFGEEAILDQRLFETFISLAFRLS